MCTSVHVVAERSVMKSFFYSASAVFFSSERKHCRCSVQAEARKGEGRAKPDRLVFAKYARKGA